MESRATSNQLRNRIHGPKEKTKEGAPIFEDEAAGPDNNLKKAINGSAGEYWLTRILLLRYIAFIYFVAFLIAFLQNNALLGHTGLLPADKYLDDVRHHSNEDIWQKLTFAPTVFWFIDYRNAGIDRCLDAVAALGMLVSGLVMVCGAANMFMMGLLWILYHSIVLIWLGVTNAGVWISFYFSVSAVVAADHPSENRDPQSCDLGLQMVNFSHHARCWPYQDTRRSVLERSDLHELPL